MMDVKKLVANAAKSVGLVSQAKEVWIYNPMLEELTNLFASCVGPHLKTASNTPLLSSALKDCIEQYFGEVERTGDHTEASAKFGRAIIAAGKEMFFQRLTVTTLDGEKEWLPMACGACEFHEKFGEENVSTERIEPVYPVASLGMLTMMTVVPRHLLDAQLITELLKVDTIPA